MASLGANLDFPELAARAIKAKGNLVISGRGSMGSLSVINVRERDCVNDITHAIPGQCTGEWAYVARPSPSIHYKTRSNRF